ncbi:MAG: ubiquinol-cytochrome c reductase iron-sulfur subunit [Frankiales bacterium]|jgi:ubiquinol-cytochrome c reductase iron-sulfur subunit|nr:ubiquinol-cytochrome c reductase iron-sulfur subunit [Frankiales bacterium]
MTDDTTTPDESAGRRPKGQPAKGSSTTAWQDQGSLIERLRARGNDRSRQENEAEADAISQTEAQLVHEREAAGERGAIYAAPGEHDHAEHGGEPLRPAVIPAHHEPTPEEIVRTEKKAERVASALFLLSSACVIGFMASYLWINVHQHPTALNVALGSTLAGALFFIGAAAIVWAKGIMPHEPAVQARYPDKSGDADKAALAETWLEGVAESGATRRKMLLGTMTVSMGTLALPAVFILRDLGPSPYSAKGGKNLLDVTAWAKDMRLVDIVTQLPVNIADVGVGSLTTVVPEHHGSASADSSVMVVRLNPEDLNLPAFKADEVLQGIIAYSKICTHAGCPVSLYEQQRHHFLCPCHQSTFDAADRGKVLFGPAARALPILPIYADDQGFLHAVDSFREPVGPSFWERG